MKKLSLRQKYFLSEVIAVPILFFVSYSVLGGESSYSILLDIMPYGGAYVAGLIYQSEIDIQLLPLYPLSKLERMLPRIKRICLGMLYSVIWYQLFANFLHRFNIDDFERLVVSLLILFVLEETFLYQSENYKLSLVLAILFSAIVIGLRVVIPDLLQLLIIALFLTGFCIFWMYHQSARRKS